jgi:hypothetical protein
MVAAVLSSLKGNNLPSTHNRAKGLRLVDRLLDNLVIEKLKG